MAKDEIRIPIIIDLQDTKIQKQSNVKDDTTSPQQGEEKAGFLDVLTGGFLISSSQKLISATGNSTLAKITGETAKWGTLAFQIFTNPNPYAAIATAAIELSALAIQKVNELKQEAQVNNQAKYNQIKSGKIYLGVGEIEIKKDIWGNKNYNKR